MKTPGQILTTALFAKYGAPLITAEAADVGAAAVLASQWRPVTDAPEDEVLLGGGEELRDYIAAAALTGWISGTRDPEATTWEPEWWAREAYRTADAMLKAREEAKP